MITSFLLGKAVPLLLKLLVGPLTFFVGRILLNVHDRIDDLGPLPKRIVVGVLAFAIAFVAHLTGTQLPVECASLVGGEISDACWQGLTAPTFLQVGLSGALGAAFAFLLHKQKKADPRS